MNNKVKALQKSNNQLDKGIKPENQEIFTSMICYIRGANISLYDQELVRQDLTGMILSAQDRGEDINSVVLGDFKEFCDEVIDNLPARSRKDKVLERVDILCSGVAILGFINLLFSRDLYRIIGELFAGKIVNYQLAVSLGTVISMLVILAASFFIVNLVLKNSFKSAGSYNRKKRMIIGGIAGVLIMVFFIVVAMLGMHVLFTVNLFLAIAVILAFFIAHLILSRI